jgi:hypothetical protein
MCDAFSELGKEVISSKGDVHCPVTVVFETHECKMLPFYETSVVL